MKRIALIRLFSACTIIFLCFLTFSCANKEIKKNNENKNGLFTFGEVLGGKHKLQKVASVEVIKEYHSPLGLKDDNRPVEKETKIEFSWEVKNGLYTASSIKREKIIAKIDDSIDAPIIEFKLENGSRDSSTYVKNIQDFVDVFVSFAIITVRTKDWDIKKDLLPLFDNKQ